MTPHKHAEVLRQIADGVPLSEFEVQLLDSTGGFWMTLAGRVHAIVSSPEDWKIRRKPQHIIVNGFKVPKPLDVMPNHRKQLFVPMVSSETFLSTSTESGSSWANVMLDRGILHSTQEAAIAHAKAMLGIDPEWEEG